jgi:hypothetical protein
MGNIIEEGCEKCGNKIMKEALVPHDQGINPHDLDYSTLAGNECDECGHVTKNGAMDRFQCTQITYANIYKICTEPEIKQLRLDPTRGLTILNKKLNDMEKLRFEIDNTTSPPTIYEVVGK